MIEITTYPEIKTIYLNFGYKGLPENIPIQRIDIRSKPTILKNVPSLALIRQELEEGEDFDPSKYQDNEAATLDFTEVGESIINVPEDGKMDDNVRESLHNLYIDANSIIFGESLDALERVVEVPESQRRYSIEEQVNDMVDELLSTIPNSQRTARVMNNIHLLVERFKELRTKFSKFDSNQNIYDIKQNGINYKPLIDRIQNIDTQFKWLIPVVANKKQICGASDAIETDDVILNKSDNDLIQLENLQDSYFRNKNTDQTLTYKSLNVDTSTILTPFSKPDNTSMYLETKNVLTNIDAIVDNLGEFKSTVFGDKNSPLSTKQYLIQRYSLGLSNIERLDLNAGKTVYLRKPMTSNDNMTIKSLIMMPEPIIRFSTINLPSTNILHKSTLHENYVSIFRLLKKNSEIIPHVINDLSKELDYDKMENQTKIGFLSGIQEFILGNNLSRESYDNDKFRQFLEIIIPKTHLFIKSVRKYVKNKISFLGFVEQLEPFAVYPATINLQQYNQIKMLVRERIAEIKESIVESAKRFNYIKNATYNTKPFSNNPILNLISDNTIVSEPFFKIYH